MAFPSSKPLPTVDYVDLSKYVGFWYELYRFPNFFEDNKKKGFGHCYNATANYSVNTDGTIKVVNDCYRENAAGQVESDPITGSAWVVNTTSNAQLKVAFFLKIFAGDYYILDLGEVNE